MAGIEVKSFDKADEVNDNFKNAKIEAVKVGNQRLMKLTLQPGWQWSLEVGEASRGGVERELWRDRQPGAAHPLGRLKQYERRAASLALHAQMGQRAIR